jgi:hypothetical protein
MLELVAERLECVFRGEVFVRTRPAGDGVHHPADKLLDAAFTLGRPELPAEILRDDDVGRLLRPEFGDLDVALLEDDLALLIANHRRPCFPFDLVERIDIRQREMTRELDSWRPLRLVRSLAGAGNGIDRAALRWRSPFHAFLRIPGTGPATSGAHLSA